MNVMFICQCEKRALTETRRILDQFAERRGDRTWQTAITHDGLATVRKVLRQTARKNTAVACHWIRGLDHSELLWIVGDASQFNERGAVPTNTTARNVLRADDENDWHTGQDIHLLTVLASLLHDLGKASVAFQKRLRGELTARNQYRHEWVSLRLFQSFVGQDSDVQWLQRLANLSEQDDASWLSRLQRDGIDRDCDQPFLAMSHAPLAQAIAWLVVSHHRLPQPPKGSHGSANLEAEHQLSGVLNYVTAYWNEDSRSKDADHHDAVTQTESGALPVQSYWDLPVQNLPVTSMPWRKRAMRVAKSLLKQVQKEPNTRWLSNPYVMHVSRMCLMLADHHYSRLGVDNGKPSLGRVEGQPGFPAYANTRFDTRAEKWLFNQTLDEHLLGVAQHGGEVTRALPSLVREMPHLARHKGLKKPTTDARFRWQNKAADLAASLRPRAQAQGAFVVNLASTGCGKTLANARIMYALAEPALGMRCAFAMGLRTLTLQTGKAFKELLGLEDDELAIRVGDAASRALFEAQFRQAEKSGSASAQDSLDADSHVLYEGNPDEHPLLRRVLHDPRAKSLITAPVLVCTIDHLVPATEGTRGGHQIAPMLRLMSSDLVLDEPDDFDMADLPALTRLVHWAGLLGTRVLLSSATLPPDLVRGLFEAYVKGRTQYQRNRGEPGAKVAPCCAWVDEFDVQHADCADGASFATQHEKFVTQRVAALKAGKPNGAPSPRWAQLALLDLAKVPQDKLAEAFASRVVQLAPALHRDHHTVAPISGQRVSFGLVRMANVAPLVEVALALYQQIWPEGLHVHLCAYHSQYPMLLRSRIEKQLDAALNRKDSHAIFDLPDIAQCLRRHPADDHLFLVLGSPVTEVGRDHDYDWAIVEPSSMRSLIQLAGRVRRHRPMSAGQALPSPNLRVFQWNLKHYRSTDKSQPSFVRPGFESLSGLDFKLNTHDMVPLLGPVLDEKGRFVIDARPRLLAAPQLKPQGSLIDLEHARMRDTMLARAKTDAAFNAATVWSLSAQDTTLTATLPHKQPFRFDKNDPREEVTLRLMPMTDGDDFFLQQVIETSYGRSKKGEVGVDVSYALTRIDDALVTGSRITPWGSVGYLQALSELAEELDMPLHICAMRFGQVTLKQSKGTGAPAWCFHPALGIFQKPF